MVDDQQLLQTKLARAEAKAAELQAYLDDDERELEVLRAKVAAQPSTPVAPAMSAAPAQGGAGAEAGEVAGLKEKLARAEAKAAELQAYLDDDERELEALRALPSPGGAGVSGHQLESTPSGIGSNFAVRATARMQSVLSSVEAENKRLRLQAVEVEQKAQLAGAHHAGEVAKQLEAERQRASAMADRVQELESQVGTDVAREVAFLRERVAELEASLHSISATNVLLAGHSGGAAKMADETAGTSPRPVNPPDEAERPNGSNADLEVLRAPAADERVAEAIGAAARKTLEAQHAAVLVEKDAALATLATELETARQALEEATAKLRLAVEGEAEVLAEYHSARRRALDAEAKSGQVGQDLEAAQARSAGRIAELEAEARGAVERAKGAAERERTLAEEVAALRARAVEAEGLAGSTGTQLAGLRAEMEHLRAEQAAIEQSRRGLQVRVAEGAAKLTELEEARAAAEKTCQALAGELASQTEALQHARREAVARPPAATAGPPVAPPPHPQEALPEGIEGFTFDRLRQLESRLEHAQVRAQDLARAVSLAERALAQAQDDLQLAHARLKDLQARLGRGDADIPEALGKLESADRELKALREELLAVSTREAAAQREAAAVLEPEAVVERDLITEPLAGFERVNEAQTTVAREATQALEGEQRARETLVADLSWLKTELEKLGSVRDELKQRLGAVLQRETRRRAVLTALLQKLRTTEVTAAARIAALRRLQAAIEQAQRTAVKVQTIFFQRQIGSLQRQLEVLLGVRKSGPAAV